MIEALKRRIDAIQFDFLGKRRIAGTASIVAVILSWVLFFVIGPNWGIDFSGGTEVQLRFAEPIDIGELRGSLARLEIPSDAIQEVGTDDREFKVRIKDAEFGAADLKRSVVDALKQARGDSWVADWERDVRFSAEVGARLSVLYQGDRVLPDELAAQLAGAIDGLKIEEGKEDNELVIKVPGLSAQVESQIAGAMSGRGFEVLSVDAVGPKVGAALRQQGFLAIVATLVLILAYVGLRFDFTYAPGAVLALVHDVSLTVGVFVVLGREFNLSIIGALLTIVGYSLNDTIVIFDRIRENRERFRAEQIYEQLNASINETLARTVNTAGTTLLAVAPFLLLGTDVIRDFVLALFVGVIVGTYSTMFIASPMIVVMERWLPKLAGLFAFDGGPATAEDDVPEQFLSAAEKRRRERDRLAKDDGSDERA